MSNMQFSNDLFLYMYMYMPSTILVLGAIVVLFSNTFASKFSRNTSLSLSMIFIASSFLFCLSLGHISNVSSITLMSEYIILISSFFFIFLTFSKQKFVEFQTPEFYPLYLFSVAGFMLMVNSSNFIVVLLGLEIGSLPLAAFMAFNRRIYGVEASIKYFVSSALASIFFILGIMFVYCYVSSFNLRDSMIYYKLGLNILKNAHVLNVMLLIFGVVFIVAGIGFKISLVPWHSWMPDVYEGSNPVIAGYISVVPKIAGFAVFASIFGAIFNGNSALNDKGYIEQLLKILLFITILLPNIMALLQKDVKRMLAFSSISHSGFALACIYLGSFETLALYWILFFITNLGAFALLWMNKPKNSRSRYDYSFEKFYGFSNKHPIISLVMALFMVSLAGIPPFSIFWGKIFIITNALQRDEIALAIIMILSSAIAVCYYLKIIVAMYFKKPLIDNEEYYEDNSTSSIRGIVLICALLCIGSIFVVSYVLDYIPLFNYIS